MKTIQGKFAEAKIYSDTCEDYAAAQIQLLCDHETAENAIIRVMPDVHPGKVGTVGLTMTVGEKLIPYLLGGDIGCGVSCVVFKTKRIEGKQLDAVIRERVPSGAAIRREIHRYGEKAHLEELSCFRHVQEKKALLSLGTLGGGNHFIEVDRDEDGTHYLAAHSGSRHLGTEVTEYYQNLAYQACRERGIPHPVSFLEGEQLEAYQHDVEIVQRFAALNRACILDEICKGMKWKAIDRFDTVHNYVAKLPDGTPLLRKGAVSARQGERLLIPINMKEGMLLCEGKGNPDWNFSAPHGAGRVYRRDQVKEHFTVSDYKREMKGIYSTCISRDTLDEAPFAYRSAEEIMKQMEETVRIRKVIRPVYNFKAGGRDKK